MITKEQYYEAVKSNEEAEKIINQYLSEQRENFKNRLKDGSFFTDDELVYSAYNLCPCGYGIAYPKDCGPDHYWDCSAILKGIASPNVEHCGKLPFFMTKMKSENNVFPGNQKPTTRGIFKPKKEESIKPKCLGLSTCGGSDSCVGCPAN